MMQMRKRLASLALALAMALALAVPAFAAEGDVPVGSYTVDLDKPNTAEMGVYGEFTVRYLTSSRSYDEPQPREDITRTLPQGSEFTWEELRSSYTTYFRFFTDLDNDGTYDERLVVRESGKYALAPYEEKYASSLAQISGKPQSADTFAAMLEEMGGELSKDIGVMTLTISSDSLCQFFGGSTLFEWGVMRGGGSDVIAKGTMLFAAKEEPAEPVPEFTDTPAWCKTEAQWAAQEGITNGYGAEDKFAPGVECTHEQILTFLWRAADEPEAKEKAPVTVASWYQDAVDWAYEQGYVGEGFDPAAPCTRAQAVSYIWKALGEHEAKEAAAFTDVDAEAPYAQAVSWAVEKGITRGDGGEDTFAPDKVCSRGHIACFLYRAYN